jgi:hypothetical protein
VTAWKILFDVTKRKNAPLVERKKEEKIRCSGRVPIATRQLLTRKKVKERKRQRRRRRNKWNLYTDGSTCALISWFFFGFFLNLCDFFLCNTDTQQTDTETEAGEKRHGAVLTKHLDCTFRSLFSLAGPDEDKWTQKLLDGCKKKRLYCRVTPQIQSFIQLQTYSLLEKLVLSGWSLYWPVSALKSKVIDLKF